MKQQNENQLISNKKKKKEYFVNQILMNQDFFLIIDQKIFQILNFDKFSIPLYTKITKAINIEMNKTSKKSSRQRKSIDKISTTNSSTKFKQIIDRNIVKINSNIYGQTKNFFSNTQKKPIELTKKIKSAITTPKNCTLSSTMSTTKLKSPKKLTKQNFYTAVFTTQKPSPVSTPLQPAIKKPTRNNYSFQYQIGSGGFGSVWKVKDKQSHQIYAMKQISKAKVIMKKSVTSVINQKLLLNGLSSPFIINALESFQDRQHLYLAMEYLRGGDLRYHLCYNQQWTQKQAKFIVACIVQGLGYVHSMGVIHRDLKPQNLVFQQSGYLRLTDFGVARKKKANNSQETSGTPGYMSPQVICRMNHSYQSDYFALGVIVYEMILGRRPYMGDSRKEIRDKILAQQAKITIDDLPSDWSSQCVDFVNKLLKRNKQSRLGYNGIDEIKHHPWMKSINWKKLANKQLHPPFSPGIVSESIQYQREMQNSQMTQLDDQTVMLLRTQQIQNLFKDYDHVRQKGRAATGKQPR